MYIIVCFTCGGSTEGFENLHYGGVGYVCACVQQACHPINP